MGQPLLFVDLLDGPGHAGFRATLSPADQRLLDRLVAEGTQHAGPNSPFAAVLHATAGRLEQDQRLPRRAQPLADAADASPVPA